MMTSTYTPGGDSLSAVAPATASSSHFEQMLAFSAKYFAPRDDALNPLLSDTSALQMENKFMKEALEKEQYRRKVIDRFEFQYVINIR